MYINKTFKQKYTSTSQLEKKIDCVVQISFDIISKNNLKKYKKYQVIASFAYLSDPLYYMH